MKMALRALIGVVVLSTCLSVTTKADAFVPYEGYEYNAYGESVPAPIGYVPEKLITGETLGAGSMNTPTDFFWQGEELYILDAGNSRIIVTDASFKEVRTIDGFTQGEEQIWFKGAQGLFVCKNGNILIADTENLRILEADPLGNLVQILERPDTQLLEADRKFAVRKVLRDTNGITYALVNGVNEGAITYLADGTFGGFFGSNDVTRTADVILNYIWRNFMTEAQIKNSQGSMPKEFTSFDLTDRDFIYTVTQSNEGDSSVRLLNYKGSNLQDEVEFGDLEWDRKVSGSLSTTFVDVDVDDTEYLYLLDSSRGRVFVYSKDGVFISVFGALGSKLGTFQSPKAVETHDGNVYVLDDIRACITVFTPTEYARTIQTALRLHDDGKYGEAKEYWEKVLDMNSNSEAAYYGIGLALEEAGQYQESLEYFKLSYEHEAYSNSFREVRKDFVKQHFLLLFTVAVIILAAVILLSVVLKKRFSRANEYSESSLEKKYTAPLFTAIHPLDGFESLKRKNGWSIPLALGILAALFLSLSASWFWTGFSFNQNRPSDFNALITFLQAFGVICVWVVSNWAVCTLMEGKGRLIDIFGVSVYALIPFLVSILVGMALSNILTVQEAAFLTFVKQAGILWTAVLIIAGLGRIHEYSLKKTIFSIFLTIIGIAVIVFLLILFFGLMRQLYSFVQSIYSELQMMN